MSELAGLLSAAGRMRARELGGGELRVVEAQRGGREVAEEVEHVAAANGVVQEDAVALLDVLDQVIAVDQHVAGEHVAHVVRARLEPSCGRSSSSRPRVFGAGI